MGKLRRLLVGGILLVLLFGCAPSALPTAAPTKGQAPPTALAVPSPGLPAKPTPTLTLTPTPTWKPSATSLATNGPSRPEDTPVLPRTQATVIRVIDGDTIEVNIVGKASTVRYIGIDTPETVDPRKQVQCFGQEASAKNKELVAGKTVQLEKDVSETDKYDRLLRYVYVDDMMINSELVRLGYARASSYPPDIKQQGLFSRLEKEAREAGRGLWAPDACLTPTAPATAPKAVQPTATPKLAAPLPKTQDCDPSYPGVCIPPPPPDLDCKDVPFRRFRVLPPDPHRLDSDRDGVGCEG